VKGLGRGHIKRIKDAVKSTEKARFIKQQFSSWQPVGLRVKKTVT